MAARLMGLSNHDSKGIKPHIIYTLLAEFGLNDESTLSESLRKLKYRDWLYIAYAMKAWYSENPMPPSMPTSGLTPLTFEFPSLPPELLPSITSYLLAGDATWLNDPLFGTVDMHTLFVQWLVKEGAILDGQWYQLYSAQMVKDIEAYIKFYLRARDLVDEGRLIPFAVAKMPESYIKFMDVFWNEFEWNSRLRAALDIPSSFYCLPRRALFHISTAMASALPAVLSQKVASAIERGFSNGVTRLREPQIAAVVFRAHVTVHSLMNLALQPRGQSTDLVSPDMAYTFRRCLKIIEELNFSLPTEALLHVPMQLSRQHLQVSMLRDIPIERVLEAILLEPEAFEHQRASLNEKLLGISAPPGSSERDVQIAEIQEMLDKERSGMSLAYSNVRAHFKDRLSIHLPLAMCGIAVAGVAASGHNLDAIASATSIGGGTGLAAASAKQLASAWLEYRRAVGELRLKDNFFIWKIHSSR